MFVLSFAVDFLRLRVIGGITWKLFKKKKNKEKYKFMKILILPFLFLLPSISANLWKTVKYKSSRNERFRIYVLIINVIYCNVCAYRSFKAFSQEHTSSFFYLKITDMHNLTRIKILNVVHEDIRILTVEKLYILH